MSKYRPTPPQIAVLSALATGKLGFNVDRQVYIDLRFGWSVARPTIRRLLLEGLVEEPPEQTLRLTVLGESVLAAYMPGAVARAFMGEEQA